jgi:uncharacterized protein (TIGR02145 family)
MKRLVSIDLIIVIIILSGLVLNSCKKKPDIPLVSTTNVSGITQTSAVSGGTVSNDGGAEVTARGVCWAVSQNPTTANNKTSDGTGTGSFTSNMTGLTSNTLYYVRAYATNSTGTGYGSEVSFTTSQVVVATVTTTAVSGITSNSAVSGGSISADGGGPVTAKGVCWSVSANPTVADSKTSDGTGNSSFTSNITGLSAATTYHVRAYATNSAGTAYGNDISFTTSAVAATLTTSAISGITQTTAVSGGNISSDGGSAVTSRGVCWNTSGNPTISDSKTSNGSGTGTFTSNITGLTAGTTYHVRAYATNSAGTAYGNDIPFTTDPVTVPVVTTADASSVTSTTAVSGGTITSTGGGSILARGVCWNTTGNPDTRDNVVSNGTGSGSFVSNISGLSSGTTYYVRAFARNSAGTAYGNQIHFITPVTDIEGNVYSTVELGTQVWMAENLMTTKYNDNSSIPLVSDNTTWSGLTNGAYCWYANNISNKPVYGALYNWFAANNSKLCPAGWHVPTHPEWTTFFQYLIDNGYGYSGTSNIGKALAATAYWRTWSTPGYVGNDLRTNNSSGFTALPGGHRYATGTYSYITETAFWWSSSQNTLATGWSRDLEYCLQTPSANFYDKNYGLSVRCVKNGTTK